MSRRKEKDPDPLPDPNAWMLSFSDTLTNLLCFFVLLLTMSSLDSKSLKETFGFFDAAVGALGRADLVKPSDQNNGLRPIVSNQLAQKVVEAMKRKIANGVKPLDAAAEALAAFTTRPEYRVVAMQEDRLEIDIAHSEIFSDDGRLTAGGREILDALSSVAMGGNFNLQLVTWVRAQQDIQPLLKTGPDSWDKAEGYARTIVNYLGKKPEFLDRLRLGARGDGVSRGDSKASAATRVTAVFLVPDSEVGS